MQIAAGSTPNFVVSYDTSLTNATPSGPEMAQAILDMCEYDLARLSILFGNILPPASSLPFHIQLWPGSGGGSNNGINTIVCNVGPNTTPADLPGLVVIEESEIFMQFQGHGWLPNWSSGEALSRVCAQILYPANAWLSSTGNWWLNGDPASPNAARSNWVDQSYPTDTDFPSIGCGSLFLNYLAYQLNCRWPDILVAGNPQTHALTETAELLGVTDPWPDFSNVISTYLPPGSSLPAEPTSFGQPAEPTDDPFPYGPLPAALPSLFLRHNLGDTGTSHSGSLSDSPDIIVKNSAVADPQTTFSTPASIASEAEGDPFVVESAPNYVYLRVWNRGSDAKNVFATVYWSPPATLVSPNLWTLLGSSYYADVPSGSQVMISNPGITWPTDRLPPTGHYCFVATVGNSLAPAPNPSAFGSFDDFMNYIQANNNITWRNFNVGANLIAGIGPFPQGFINLPFHIVGAWDSRREFALETNAELPPGSKLMLQTAHWIGHGLKPGRETVEEVEDFETDALEPRRVRIPLGTTGVHELGEVALPSGTVSPSHLLVHIPSELHRRPFLVSIRQLYEGKEVGRVTWKIGPK